MPPPKDPVKYEGWRKKKSEAMKGKFIGENSPCFGKVPWNKGKKNVQSCSDETKEKMRIAHSGERNHNFGKPMPESVKTKLSEVLKNQYANGRVQTEEHRKKNSIANKGKKRTPETCKKIGAIHKGKVVSEKTRRKLHISHKGLQAREKHPNWKDDITPLMNKIRGCEEMNTLRKFVFRRDGWCDFYSGCKGGGLELHHIIPLSVIVRIFKIDTFEKALACKFLFDPDNCVTMRKSNHIAHHDIYGKNGEFFKYLHNKNIPESIEMFKYISGIT